METAQPMGECVDVGACEWDRRMLAIVAHNVEQEIERALAPPADALRVALMMRARRRRWNSLTCSR